MLTEKEDEVLEAIWTCAEVGDFSPESVHKRCAVEFEEDDLDGLERRGLIVRNGDTILFSREGRAIAEKVIRRHRLAEVLVVSVLRLKKAEMEEVACKVEHSLLPEVEEAICTILGHPETCPDGKPIPKGRCCKNGTNHVDKVVVSLHDLRPGETAKIAYVKPGTSWNLHQLVSLGLHPGSMVTVQRKLPAFCVRVDNTEIAIDEVIARSISVWPTGHG